LDVLQLLRSLKDLSEDMARRHISPVESVALCQKAVSPSGFHSAVNEYLHAHYLSNSVFVHGTWLKAWFLGQPMYELEMANGGSTGGKGSTSTDAIDITGDADAELAKVIAQSKAEAEDAKLKEAKQQKVSEDEQRMLDAAIKASHESGTIQSETAAASEMRDVQDASSSAAPAATSHAMDEAAAAVAHEASAEHAAGASSSAAAAVSPASAPILTHPLYPGDLSASLLPLLCKHGFPNPRHSDLRRISRAAWDVLRDDNELQQRHLLKEYLEKSGRDAASVPPINASMELPCSKLCRDCCSELNAENEQHDMDTDRRNALLDDVLNAKSDDKWVYAKDVGDSMFISAPALTKWRTKALAEKNAGKFESPSRDLDLNQQLLCGHGALDPQGKKVPVPRVSWRQHVHSCDPRPMWYSYCCPLDCVFTGCVGCVLVLLSEDYTSGPARPRMPSMQGHP
jgi:hypothetical protein